MLSRTKHDGWVSGRHERVDGAVCMRVCKTPAWYCSHLPGIYDVDDAIHGQGRLGNVGGHLATEKPQRVVRW